MSLFDQEQKPSTFDESKNYLEEITAPGAQFDRTKYKTDAELLAALAKKAAHGDHFIAQRNKDFDQLREDHLALRAEAKAAEKFEEFYQKMTNKEPVLPKEPKEEDRLPTAFIDESTIDQLIAKRFSEKEAHDREQANLAEVDRRVTERFGNNAQAVISERMKTLGLSIDDAKFIAKKSANALLNALGLNEVPQQQVDMPRSSVRSDNFSPTGGTKRTASYWENLRKTDPKKYFSPENNIQRMKDIDELGEDFDDVTRKRRSQ